MDRPIFPATEQALAELQRQASGPVAVPSSGPGSELVLGRPPIGGPSVVRGPTGHQVIYGDHGRRVLCLDPGGTILHECEWVAVAPGRARLVRARVRLDSLLWIGVIPEATIRTAAMGRPCRSRRPPVWDELRRTAAVAWGVSLEDVRYFYPDSSFALAEDGTVTISLKKDGLFWLEDGTFARPTFVSFMGAVPWDRIDLLNVVELFQSTFPGTGSAVLELFWGLCDDQQQSGALRPLRYRGLPTYPSEAAYGLFSAFFQPVAPSGTDPRALFMKGREANRIAWWLRPDPPWRYFDRNRRLTVTVQNGMIQKVTVTDDPAGLPYVAPGSRGGWAPCGRTVVATGGQALLRDGAAVRRLDLDPAWGVTHESLDPGPPAFPYDWRAFFDGQPPMLDPALVQALALRYPDDETETPELSTQPFVLEQCVISLNQRRGTPAGGTRAPAVLIDGFDAVAADCIREDTAGLYRVLYRHPEWAQRQAQVLWDRAARVNRLETIRATRFVPRAQWRGIYNGRYDLIYCWIPFALYRDTAACLAMLTAVSAALARGGLALVAGPSTLRSRLAVPALRVLEAFLVEDLGRLPLLTEHRRLHPRTRLRADLALFLAEQVPTTCLTAPG
ncbi:hypothetical protein [Nitrospira sp. Kam-Ns4a]